MAQRHTTTPKDHGTKSKRKNSEMSVSVISKADDLKRDADQIAGTLLREMDHAQTFSHLQEAARALLNLRPIEREMAREVGHLESRPRTAEG